MDEAKKKPIMIGIILVCIGLAAAVTFIKGFGGGGGIDGIPDDQMIWVKCINPKCGAAYETSEKEYYEQVRARAKSAGEGQISLAACEKCGKESIQVARKCEKCGNVFVEGSIPNDFYDRCPKCKYSKKEEIRGKRRR